MLRTNIHSPWVMEQYTYAPPAGPPSRSHPLCPPSPPSPALTSRPLGHDYTPIAPSWLIAESLGSYLGSREGPIEHHSGSGRQVFYEGALGILNGYEDTFGEGHWPGLQTARPVRTEMRSEREMLETRVQAEMWADNELPEEGKKRVAVKPFISKLVALLSDPGNYGDLIAWSRDGRSFTMATSDPRWAMEVLPAWFSHCSMPALRRQLTTYAFKHEPAPTLNPLSLSRTIHNRPNSLSSCSSYSHPLFYRDDLTRISELAAIPSRARKLAKETRMRKGASH